MTGKMRTWVAGGAAVCLLVLVAGWFLLVSPKRSAAAEVRGQVVTQQAANAVLAGQIAQLQQQAKGLVAKQAELQAVGRRVPSDPQLPALIRALYGARTTTGVDLVSLAPGAPVAATSTLPGAAPYKAIPVVLEVKGDYSQMTLFLDELETLQRLYIVKAVELTLVKGDTKKVVLGPDGTPQTTHTLSATVTGEVYTTTTDTTSLSLPALTGAPGAAPGSAGTTPASGASAPGTATN